jgi:glutamate dehydrogenase
MASTGMSLPERDALLESMTDEVAEMVLADNTAQTLTLAIARQQAAGMANVHARYLTALEADGWINRALEFLPTDKQIAERQTAGAGLTMPEFAVLLAYTKNSNIQLLTASNLPDDAYLERELSAYFPTPLRERYATQIGRHRLRREIIATSVGNQMANISGISFDHRITEDTGADIVEIARAWIAARDILGAADLWEHIEDLTRGTEFASVVPEVQLELFFEARRMLERGVLWLLRHRRPPIDLASTVERFRVPMAQLAHGFDELLTGRLRDQVFAVEAGRLAGGVPEHLAQASATWPLTHTGFDIVELALAEGADVREVARTYWHVFDELQVGWIWEAVGALPRHDRWQTQARYALRDDLLAVLGDLTADARRAGSVAAWRAGNEAAVARTNQMFTEIRRAERFDLTVLAVALRQLRNLAITTHRHP